MKKWIKRYSPTGRPGVLKFILFNLLTGKKVYISITDKAGKIIYVNDRFAKLTKYNKRELIGQNHRMLKSGYHSSDEFDNLWSTISKGSIWRGVLNNRAKDGTFFLVDTLIKPITGKNKQPKRYVAIRFSTKNQQQ